MLSDALSTLNCQLYGPWRARRQECVCGGGEMRKQKEQTGSNSKHECEASEDFSWLKLERSLNSCREQHFWELHNKHRMYRQREFHSKLSIVRSSPEKYPLIHTNPLRSHWKILRKCIELKEAVVRMQPVVASKSHHLVRIIHSS